MTYRKFRYFLELANAADITTLGELEAFKRENGIMTNDQLFRVLFSKTKNLAS